MKLLDLLITAIALSMDALAVSIGKGLSVKRLKASHCLITGAYFGGFQALMPLLGFLLASSFASYIQKFDHWIACVLLVLIGANMLREAFSKEEEQGNDSFSFRVMLPLAIATSIDALATGGAALVGETSLQTVRRELREETGIEADEADFHLVRSFREHSTFSDVYFLFHDIPLSALHLQPGETTEARWVSKAGLEALVASGEVAQPDVRRLRQLRDEFRKIWNA